jgi:hypothetical protein
MCINDRSIIKEDEMNKHWFRLVAIMAILALVLVACGGDEPAPPRKKLRPRLNKAAPKPKPKQHPLMLLA